MLRPSLAAVVLLAACGTPVAPPLAPAPPPPSPTASATAASATAAEPAAPAPSYVARGTLLGHDGKPMKLAHVRFGGTSTPVDAAGRFRITANGPGPLPVRFTGVDHADLALALHFDGSEREIEVTLGTDERLDAPFPHASVMVFARREAGTPPVFVARRAVKRQLGGLYGADIDLKPLKGGEFFYALEDVARGHRIVGLDSESFEVEAEGGYVGRLRARGAVAHVIVDAAKLPPAGLRPRVRLTDPACRAARITGLWLDASRRVEEESLHGPQGAAWRAEILRALGSERDAEVSAALRMAYLVPPSGLGSSQDEAVGVARALLHDLPADAPLWAFAPEAAMTAVELVGRSKERDAYLDQLGEGLRDRDQAAAYLASRLRAASLAGRSDEAARVFATIRRRFPGSAVDRAAAFYDPARAVRPGAELPDFDMPAFVEGTRGASAARITRASLRGKVVLIDFWGFWCIPCVAEMRAVHEVFARHKDAGFTIVSVAVNSAAPAVRTFRRVQWPMPWQHVVLDANNQDEVLERFGIKSYPSPILVDAAGKVVAAGEELRGEGLERAVMAALRAKAAAP